MLEACGQPLVDAYDLLMLDLDGVVYVGEDAVPGAPVWLEQVRERGASLAFVTNNASRPPAGVAAKLRGLGVAADPDDVVTSAQAAAHLLLDAHGAGSLVAVLGADGLREAVTEAGLRTTSVHDEAAVALVSGFGPDVVWSEVMRAATRIRDGLPWVASNTDLTFPSTDGLAPGHGALVSLLSGFAGVVPPVAGKPEPPLLQETVRRVGGQRPLMIGDRLDTDIEGARRVGVDSLLVLTGVTGLEALVAAPAEQRPTFLGLDLGGLLEPHPLPAPSAAGWVLGGWTARTAAGRLVLDGHGGATDWWRVTASAAWQHLDVTGRPPDTGDLVPPEPGPGR